MTLSAYSYGQFQNQKVLPTVEYPPSNKIIIAKDNVTFLASRLQMTAEEQEIFEMEAMECKALLKRDTIVLKNLWERDFTANQPVNVVVAGKNPLPYYVSYSRAVENFMIKGDLVYTSGHETFQQLRSDSRLEDPIKRIFYHTWIKKFSGWRLVAKSYE